MPSEIKKNKRIKMHYNKNGVSVDDTRYMVEGTTYPINTLSSVKAYKDGTSLRTLIIGIIFLSIAVTALIDGEFIMFLLLGVPATLFLLWWKYMDQYIVKITSNSGEVDSYNSRSVKDIKSIVEAINTAIVNRG